MGECAGRARAGARRRRWLLRASIFIGIAAVAQADVALPPGPQNVPLYWASLAILVVCALVVLLPSRRFPRWTILAPTIAYEISVTLLLISAGTDPSARSTAGGLSALVLLPVLAMALSYPGWYTAIVVFCAVLGLSVVGAAGQASATTELRRLLLWTAVAVVVAVTVHHLRNNLEGKVRDAAEFARMGRLVSGTTRSLTSLRQPDEVIAEGTLALLDLVGSDFRAVSYLRVSDGVVTQEAIAGDRVSTPTSYLLKDDPYVQNALDSGAPLIARVERSSMGPTLRSVTDGIDLTEVAFVPVTVNGELHGMFEIGGLGVPMTEDLLARCQSMADVVELALANAIAHQELELQANTDPLTGVSNRRGLSLYLQGDPRRDALSVLVLDIDHLKAINDMHGHDVGDRILVAVARAVAGTLRGGDLLARTGGDEFLAVVADADESAARRVADRVTDAVSRITVQGVGTSVSVGFASGGVNGDVDRLVRRADKAMYEAKHVARPHHARHSRVIDRA
jgi:diguanylate cyclase (GGDEF)-like protein